VKYLVDVNVVLPLLVSEHSHRIPALAWFNSTGDGEVVLPRLTRLGVLRLLCNTRVMGPDIMAPAAAMEALIILERDGRIVLARLTLVSFDQGFTGYAGLDFLPLSNAPTVR
jgi:predicted nucleic acid-binding protein